MKTYKEILDEVRKENPEMKMREAQIAASTIFKQQKDAADKAGTASKPAANIPPKPQKGAVKFPGQPKSTHNQANEICDAINKAGNINRNSILSIARSYDSSFHLVKDHKVGVNWMVYLDGPYRVPTEGFWKIFTV
jgi:hypothetical protein